MLDMGQEAFAALLARRLESDDSPKEAIKLGREFMGKTQESFAELMSKNERRAWTRVVIARLERGDKRITISDLLAIARVQRLPLRWYLEELPASHEARMRRYVDLVDGANKAKGVSVASLTSPARAAA